MASRRQAPLRGPRKFDSGGRFPRCDNYSLKKHLVIFPGREASWPPSLSRAGGHERGRLPTNRFNDADMHRRSLVYLLLAVATAAHAGPIFLVADNGARTLFLQTDTVRQDSVGLVDFTMRAVAKHGYRPTGASETIAIALTDYQMDCWRGRVRETGTRYVTDEDKEAGRAPDIAQAWAAIPPGSELDVVRKKVC